MSIFNDTFSVYERLASAKMRSLVSQINAHTHDGTYGVQIPFSSLYGQIAASQIPNSIITSAMIVDGTIVGNDIANGTITYNKLDTSSTIHLSSDGYAVYAP
jgi:hypothetical protein